VSLYDLTRRALHTAVPKGLRPAVKAPFYALRSMIRRIRRGTSPDITAEVLARDLARGGIEAGDTICVHGSLSQIGNVRGGGAAVIRALQAAVSPRGTLLMPAYGSADQVFADASPEVDLRTAASMTGALTEIFRASDGVRRSSHPFSSVCAWGTQADFVIGGHADDPRICHPGSPLARLHQLGGKVMGIGITLGPVSFYHVVEDAGGGFPVEVYDPPRTVRYVDATGASMARPVMRYKAELVRKRIDSANNSWIRDRFTEDFERRGIIRYFSLGAARCWVIDSQAMFDAVRDLADRGITIYTTPGDRTEPWPNGPETR